MQTILVIYTDFKIVNDQQIARNKRYYFNIDSDVKVGDLIKTFEYSTNIQVVKILNEAYRYYNGSTEELSNTFTSSLQWQIKTIQIYENKNIILGVKI